MDPNASRIRRMHPTIEDQRKLHAEINQLVNQRFTITVAAFTLTVGTFGTIGALSKSGEPSGENPALFNDSQVFYFGSIAVLSLLLILFLWSHWLKNIIGERSEYLKITGTSSWEADWAEYKNTSTHYMGYTKSQSFMFIILGVLASIYPWFGQVAEGSAGCPSPLIHRSYVGIVICYFLMVIALGFLNIRDASAHSETTWRAMRDRYAGTEEEPTANTEE